MKSFLVMRETDAWSIPGPFHLRLRDVTAPHEQLNTKTEKIRGKGEEWMERFPEDAPEPCELKTNKCYYLPVASLVGRSDANRD
jgi:hypothetical protein